MVSQRKCTFTVSLILQFLALLCGVLSFALPFWVAADSDDGEQMVLVSRRTNKWLWLKRDTFELPDLNSKRPKWNGSWKIVNGTSLDTAKLQAVKGTLVPGLVFQFVCLCSLVVVCHISEETYLRHRSNIFCYTILSTFLSTVLVAIGPILFATKVIKDYQFHKKRLDVGFWFSVASASVSFVTFLLLIATYCCYRRKKKERKSNCSSSQSVEVEKY